LGSDSAKILQPRPSGGKTFGRTAKTSPARPSDPKGENQEDYPSFEPPSGSNKYSNQREQARRADLHTIHA